MLLRISSSQLIRFLCVIIILLLAFKDVHSGVKVFDFHIRSASIHTHTCTCSRTLVNTANARKEESTKNC